LPSFNVDYSFVFCLVRSAASLVNLNNAIINGYFKRKLTGPKHSGMLSLIWESGTWSIFSDTTHHLRKLRQ